MSRPSHETRAGNAYLRLRALSRAEGRATAEYLQLFALEGFAARLEQSPLRDRLVLKGGLLLSAFGHRRPTRDVDLLAVGIPNDEPTMREVVADICSVEVGDGLEIARASIRSQPIREGTHYAGVRVSLEARLTTANLPFHVDINVGDPVVPGPARAELPRLLGGAPIQLLGYPMEMVIAEKLVTAFERGGANTRWRDFVDLRRLLGSPAVDPQTAILALRRVAEHRAVDLGPFEPIRGSLHGHAQPKWAAWLRKQGLTEAVPSALDDVLEALESAADPLLSAAASAEGDTEGDARPSRRRTPES